MYWSLIGYKRQRSAKLQREKEGLKIIAQENPTEFKEIMNQKSLMERSWNFLTGSMAVVVVMVGIALLVIISLILFRVGQWS